MIAFLGYKLYEKIIFLRLMLFYLISGGRSLISRKTPIYNIYIKTTLHQRDIIFPWIQPFLQQTQGDMRKIIFLN